jgi:hypothetical protein
MEPVMPSTVKLAFRKYIVLKMGVEKETTASKMVATRVVMKPGVAGLRKPMVVSERWNERGAVVNGMDGGAAQRCAPLHGRDGRDQVDAGRD